MPKTKPKQPWKNCVFSLEKNKCFEVFQYIIGYIKWCQIQLVPQIFFNNSYGSWKAEMIGDVRKGLNDRTFNQLAAAGRG